MTGEDIQHDLQRMDHGDKEIFAQFEQMREKLKAKGLPYIEVAKSKAYGYIKYLLKEDPNGTVEVTDLDNNNTYTFVTQVEPRSKRQHEQVRNWIKGTN